MTPQHTPPANLAESLAQRALNAALVPIERLEELVATKLQRANERTLQLAKSALAGARVDSEWSLCAIVEQPTTTDILSDISVLKVVPVTGGAGAPMFIGLHGSAECLGLLLVQAGVQAYDSSRSAVRWSSAAFMVTADGSTERVAVMYLDSPGEVLMHASDKTKRLDLLLLDTLRRALGLSVFPIPLDDVIEVGHRRLLGAVLAQPGQLTTEAVFQQDPMVTVLLSDEARRILGPEVTSVPAEVVTEFYSGLIERMGWADDYVPQGMLAHLPQEAKEMLVGRVFVATASEPVIQWAGPELCGKLIRDWAPDWDSIEAAAARQPEDVQKLIRVARNRYSATES